MIEEREDGTIVIAGKPVPRPHELRPKVRDLGIVVAHLPVPFPEWEEELRELRIMLVMSELLYMERPHE